MLGSDYKTMEALGRVELPTNGLGNRCSIHLSYRAACLTAGSFSVPQADWQIVCETPDWPARSLCVPTIRLNHCNHRPSAEPY